MADIQAYIKSHHKYIKDIHLQLSKRKTSITTENLS